MVHYKRDQKDLACMTDQHKRARTTPESFAKRNNLLLETDVLYITKNEYPHKDRGKFQLVIWIKDIKWYQFKRKLGLKEELAFHKNKCELNGLIFSESIDKDRSVPFRKHYHLYDGKKKYTKRKRKYKKRK